MPTARFETTCPHCQADFDVDEDANRVDCPVCQSPVRLVDESEANPPPGAQSASVQSPTEPPRPLTKTGKAALANALAAPIVSTLVVYTGFPALLVGGLGALAFVASLPIGIALASAIVAARTGLRGAGWTVPVAVALLGSFLFWQDGLVGLVAGVYLPVGASVAVVVLGLWVAVSAARRTLAKDVPALQVGGLTVTFAIATVAAFVLVFLRALVAET